MLKERKHIFDEFFTAEETVFVDSNGDFFMETLVWCHDLVGFAQTLALHRNQNFGDLVEKIGMDSGKGIIFSNIIFKIYLYKGHLKTTLEMYDPDNIFSPAVSRTTRAQGIGSRDKVKELGVLKIMILASVQGVPENHVNCKIILDKLNINQMLYTFTGDLKLYNIGKLFNLEISEEYNTFAYYLI